MDKPSKQDREEFRLFCRQATDRQLEDIILKEKRASEWDEGREIYAEIAEAESDRRGKT